MATYSIKDLAKLSGIKAHTIRIWEQRYAIIEPKRTASNIRYYNDEDLNFLMNIAFLNRKGLRISKIAKMTRQDIFHHIEDYSKSEVEETDHFQALLLSMMQFDQRKFENLINDLFLENGVEGSILKVLVPFLEKISLLLLAGTISPVHEQFVSAIIRRKVINAIDQIAERSLKSRYKILLYLSDASQQELYLLFVEFLMRLRSIDVVYLGSNVAFDDLKFILSSVQVDYIYTIVSEHHKRYITDSYIDVISGSFKEHKFLISGFQNEDESLKPMSNICYFDDLSELLKFLS